MVVAPKSNSSNRARDLRLEREVAVKVLPRKMSDNAEFIERFYKEGKAAARLSHNNVVQAIDVTCSCGKRIRLRCLYDEKD